MRGADARTKSFTCELRGEGSLPSLTLQVRVCVRGGKGISLAAFLQRGIIGRSAYTAEFPVHTRQEHPTTATLQEPSVFDASGRPWLKFGRLLRGRGARLLVNARNNGSLPVSARLEMERHEAFAVVEGPQVRVHCC